MLHLISPQSFWFPTQLKSTSFDMIVPSAGYGAIDAATMRSRLPEADHVAVGSSVPSAVTALYALAFTNPVPPLFCSVPSV